LGGLRPKGGQCELELCDVLVDERNAFCLLVDIYEIEITEFIAFELVFGRTPPGVVESHPWASGGHAETVFIHRVVFPSAPVKATDADVSSGLVDLDPVRAGIQRPCGPGALLVAD
jgi:hypothetical protein